MMMWVRYMPNEKSRFFDQALISSAKPTRDTRLAGEDQWGRLADYFLRQGAILPYLPHYLDVPVVRRQHLFGTGINASPHTLRTSVPEHTLA